MVSSQHKEVENGQVGGLEENEPMLKYTQIENDFLGVLEKDSVSCVTIHPKFICIGTHRGVIFLLDHLGNVNKELQVHDVAINQLSIDNGAEHIASCHDDGKVLVSGLYTNCVHTQEISLKRRVRSVAIDPFYHKSGSGRRLIIGERHLILHEKISFSKWKRTVLEDATAEGGVKLIKWSPSGDLLLWASYREFRIYDLVSRTSHGLSQWSMNAPIDLKCHACWKGSKRVIVGWGDSVQVYDIQLKADIPSAYAGKFSVELVFSLPMESIVCGVGPLEDKIAVFCCGSDGILVGERPHILFLQPGDEKFTVLRTDLLPLNGFENYDSSQYSLDCLSDEGRFVIVSSLEIFVACPFDTDERVDWFLKQGKYQMALDAIQQSPNPPVRHSRMRVGLAYIDHLLDSQKYEDAAALCPNIIGVNKVIWEQQLKRFAVTQQLRTVADYLPISHTSSLPRPIYDMVLGEYLRLDHKGFLEKIKCWPMRLYNRQAIADSIWKHILDTGSNPILLEALAVLYYRLSQYDKSLALYVKLRFKDVVFDLIKKHNLYFAIHKSAIELMEIDSTQAVEAMLAKPEVDPQRIRDALVANSYYLYLYLDSLHKRRSKQCTKFHTDLVRLYAAYNKDELSKLLRNSDQYSIQEALEICKARHFIEEMVYLLGRAGNTRDALKLIFTEINDLERAIDFCKEYDDEELWDDLIDFSFDKPSCINMLLKTTATHIDPSVLIQRIDNKLEIPNLGNALVKMMQDYELHVRIQEDVSKVISLDHYDLHIRQLSTRKRGLAVRYDNHCGACCNKLLMENLREGTTPNEVTVFNCSHMFHSHCLPMEVNNQAYCTICCKKAVST